MNESEQCPICSGETHFLGRQLGKLDSKDFVFKRCESCHFSFVQNFRVDFEKIYDENYYCGRGADPMVDYVYEFQNPSCTIRNYEWSGIGKIFHKLCPDGGRWLDFGCGAGGLVRFALNAGIEAVGFEEGWAAKIGQASGAPILNEEELAAHAASFDFVSAIEVLEHVPNPVAVLKKIRKLLKPGGVLFITTGNAQPWRDDLLAWSYTTCPDVHISFYEPDTLAVCMAMAGFKPQKAESLDGFVDIIKYKILKSFRVKNMNGLVDLLPWKIIAIVVDARHQISRQPYGVAI